MKKLLAFGMLCGPLTFAQNVSINKVELAGEKVVVHYSLQDSNPGNEYQLKLYSSKDNFMSPLAKVTGEVGDEVKSGIGKKIEWKIIDEFGPYKGKITRRYMTSGGKEYVPDGRPGMNSPFARKMLEALRSRGGKDLILTLGEIDTFIEALKPQPRAGEFGGNAPGSDFIFIAR